MTFQFLGRIQPNPQNFSKVSSSILTICFLNVIEHLFSFKIVIHKQPFSAKLLWSEGFTVTAEAGTPFRILMLCDVFLKENFQEIDEK